MATAQPPSPAQNADLAEKFSAVRRTTEQLCAPLSAEDQMIQSMPDASPPKWHQAHTTWFFETFILLPHAPDYRPLDSSYAYLFNSYYKQLGGHPVRANRGLLSRPSLQEVQAYRRYVDDHMLRLIESGTDGQVAARVELGLNHEQQHQELILTDIKHGLWMHPLRSTYLPNPADAGGEAEPLRWFDYEGGLHWIGDGGEGFAFDNEGPRHQEFLRPFRIASRLVTNLEYLDFIRDRGYSRAELWLSEGWDAVAANGWQAPLYWNQSENGRTVNTLTGERPLHPAEPLCHVSYYEADAYARWAGARLPSETEWEVCASRMPAKGNLLEVGRFHPARAPKAQVGPAQLFGDTWEWTASPYVAYPGLRPAAGALGEYNGKFMCNQLGTARRLLRDAGFPYPRQLSQLLSPASAVAVFRDPLSQ